MKRATLPASALRNVRKARDVDPEFKVRDCVVLRSGGPPMTIVRVDPHEYADANPGADLMCWWQNEKGEHRSAVFRPCMLDYWGN